MKSKSSLPQLSLSCKILVTLSIIFFISMLILVMVSIHNPAPEVIIHYLSVSNFQISDSSLVAEWVAKISIFKHIPPIAGNKQPIMSKDSFYERVESFISYKEHVLAVNSTLIEPVWGMLGLDTLIVKFSTRNLEGDQMEVKDWVLDEIKKDRDNGAVVFGMEIVVWTKEYTKAYWGRCVNLRVDFNQAKLVATSVERCYVTNWYHPLNALYR